MKMSNRPFKEYGTQDDIARVLQRLRSALTDLFLSAGVNPSETRASARELGISKDVFWRVARMTLLDDILELSSQVPSRASIERVIEATVAKGSPISVIEKVREAIDEFEEMVESSSTDRTTFDLMLAGLASGSITERQENIRKQAFLANSSIWGVQAQVAFKAFFMAPSKSDSTRIDLANISGMIGFKRLRQVAWPIYQRRIYNDKGSAYSQTHEPIGETPAASGIPLISEFCSKPIPKIRWRSGDAGRFYEIESDLIGNAGAASIVLGGIARDSAGLYSDQNNKRGGLIYELFTPSELVRVDLLVHKDLPYDMPPDVSLFDRLSCPRGYNPDMDERGQLPLSSSIVSLGSGISGCSTPRIPRYLHMLEKVIGEFGHDPDMFRAYRFALKYPPVPSAVILRFNLPIAPK